MRLRTALTFRICWIICPHLPRLLQLVQQSLRPLLLQLKTLRCRRQRRIGPFPPLLACLHVPRPRKSLSSTPITLPLMIFVHIINSPRRRRPRLRHMVRSKVAIQPPGRHPQSWPPWPQAPQGHPPGRVICHLPLFLPFNNPSRLQSAPSNLPLPISPAKKLLESTGTRESRNRRMKLHGVPKCKRNTMSSFMMSACMSLKVSGIVSLPDPDYLLVSIYLSGLPRRRCCVPNCMKAISPRKE